MAAVNEAGHGPSMFKALLIITSKAETDTLHPLGHAAIEVKPDSIICNQGAPVPGQKQPDALFPELRLVVIAEEIFQVKSATTLFGVVFFRHRLSGCRCWLGKGLAKGALQELEVAACPSEGGHENLFPAVTAGNSVEGESSLR